MPPALHDRYATGCDATGCGRLRQHGVDTSGDGVATLLVTCQMGWVEGGCGWVVVGT